MTIYRKREIGVLLARALRQAPVVVVSGLRHSGKSTLLRQDPVVRAGRAYRTLDDLNVLAGAQSAPQQFLAAEPVMGLDEVQRLPSLFLPLKQTIDEDRRPGRYEVDLVIEHGRKVLAIEIKAGGRVTPDDARALDWFMARTPNCVGGVVTYFGRELVPLGENRWAVPVSLLLS